MKTAISVSTVSCHVYNFGCTKRVDNFLIHEHICGKFMSVHVYIWIENKMENAFASCKRCTAGQSAVTNLGPSCSKKTMIVIFWVLQWFLLCINAASRGSHANEFIYFKWGLNANLAHAEKRKGGNPNQFQIPSMLTNTGCTESEPCISSLHKFPTTP